MESLLSRDVAHSMGMALKVDEIQNIYRRLPEGRPVKIHPRGDTKSYCATIARRIRFTILPKVKSKLGRLEGDNIIDGRPIYRRI